MRRPCPDPPDPTTSAARARESSTPGRRGTSKLSRETTVVATELLGLVFCHVAVPAEELHGLQTDVEALGE
jgi:hypothetical protein